MSWAPPQEPAWWSAAVATAAATPPAPVSSPTLFDSPLAPAPPVPTLANAVLRSKPYAAQRKLAGRAALTDNAIAALLTGLLGAAGHRLPPPRAAAALGVPVGRLRGAVPQAQRLLNIEGYTVLRLDADGRTLVLDETLLREQFGVSQ